MNNLMDWYTRNYAQITWFIIGWMSLAALTDFGRGDWTGVALDVFLIWVNYHFYKQR
jgi:hypothetical protein